MDTPRANAQPVLQRPPTRQLALATIAPLVVVVYAAPSAIVVYGKYGAGAVSLVLAGWCVVLLGSAAWLDRILFNRRRSILPFLAALGVILSVWLWQRLAFNLLVPYRQLTYGYFLHPEGAKAQFWVLVCPFWTGLACLSVCFIGALVLGWRAGARFSLACLVPWWLAAFVVFVLPTLYLDGQGNASIFI
jgi:hypothetical protein